MTRIAAGGKAATTEFVKGANGKWTLTPVREKNAVPLEDFLKPMGLSQYRLAKEIHVPLRRVNEIALGRRGISADTALRFARFFGTTPEVWQNLQSQYEMDVAKSSVWDRIVETVKPLRRTAACL